jgi:hypothetical protein
MRSVRVPQTQTVDQVVELVDCSHPVINPGNGERVTIDESMLLSSLKDHNGVVDVDEIEGQPVRFTIAQVVLGNSLRD